MTNAIIFDFDGLILDTETIEMNMWLEIFAEYGIEFDLEAFRESIGSYNIHPYDPASVLAGALNNGKSKEAIKKEFYKRSMAIAQNSEPLPGVMKIIQEAREKDIKLAIGSSSPLRWVKPFLVRFGIWDYFDTVVTNDDVVNCKPSPEIFLLVLERLGVQPEQAIVLEDSANGVMAARRAGIPVIVVPNSVTQSQTFDGVLKRFKSLEELDLDVLFTQQTGWVYA